MKPMLARTYGPRYSSFPCYVQPKLNGIRALYQDGMFQSRDEKLWSPEMLREIRQELRDIAGDHILDGELYVHGWRLQRINAAVAVNRSQPTEDTPHVEFHVFDVVDPSCTFWGRNLQPRTHIALTGIHPHVRLVETQGPIYDREQLDYWFRHYVSLGYEGVMLRPDGPYEFGERQGTRVPHKTSYRSKYLWKYKQFEDDEHMCVGWTQGEGKASIGMGALVLAKTISVDGIAMMETPIQTFNCGTGFTDAERIFYAAQPPIGRLVKVRYPYLSADGIPQCPSFLAVL